MTAIPRLLRKSRGLRNREALPTALSIAAIIETMCFDSFYLCTMRKRISRAHRNFRQRRNPMTKSLTGKVALVTDGSRGIGASFVTGTALNVDGGFGA